MPDEDDHDKDTTSSAGQACDGGLATADMDIPVLNASLSSARRVRLSSDWLTFVVGHVGFLIPDAEHHKGADGRHARTSPAISKSASGDHRTPTASDVPATTGGPSTSI